MSNDENFLDDSEDDALLVQAANDAERQYRQQTTLGGDPLARQPGRFEFRGDHIVHRKSQWRTGEWRTDEQFEMKESFNLAVLHMAPMPFTSEKRGQFFFFVLCFLICIVCFISFYLMLKDRRG